MSALLQGRGMYSELPTDSRPISNGKLAPPLLSSLGALRMPRRKDPHSPSSRQLSLRCSSEQQPQPRTAHHQNDGEERDSAEEAVGRTAPAGAPPEKFQSSWDAKDSQGRDYLYRLGKEASNVNITVGARAGLVDHVFTGDFLGKEADIVFAYRQKVTRSFDHLQGDYYIAPAFMEKIVMHIVKNYIASSLDARVPLILGVWGGKGQGKTFQTELIFKALKVEPVIMSAGEMESEWAGAKHLLL